MPKDYFLSLEGDDSLEFQSDEEEELSMMDTDVDEKSLLLSGHESYNESDTRKVSGERRKAVIYEEALYMCGFGKFHIFLLFMCGWAVSSDAIEVLSVSFLLPAATCDLSLSSDDKGWLNAVVFLGMMVGGYFWGSLADKWGRRNILIWSLLVNGVGNLGSSVSQVFWLFLICRFFSGVGVGGSMPVVFTYYTEFQHKSRRGAMISLLATFWMTGNIVAAGLAWIVIPREYLSFYSGDFIFNSWRVFVALCTLPSLTAGAMFVLMPESPKYLLQKGREQDAIAVLKQVHSANNNNSKPFQEHFGQHLFLSLDLKGPSEEDIEGCSNLKICEAGFYQKLKSTSSQLIQSTLRLFGLSLRRTTITLLLINFSLAFGYYGLFLWFPELFNRIDKYGGSFCDSKSGNSTDNSTICQPGNNVYIDSFLTSISNLPGNILSIFIVERVGRKPLLASSMVLSGLSVFFLWFVKERWQSVLMSCLFGAISVVGFNMLDVLQTELFPTEVRSTSFGVQTAALRVGAILGNVIFGLLVDTYCAVPMFLVAGLLAFGGLASLILPKTTGIDIH